MAKLSFDAIIVGGGIIGRLTAWLMTKYGEETLLLEQHTLNKSMGSSRGSSRIYGETHIDKIYFELARQSRSLWQELEHETGRRLLYLNGGLDIFAGSDAKKNIDNLVHILRSRGSLFEIFDGHHLKQRYPQWQCSPNTYAIFSPDSGILQAEHCMNAATVVAKNHKALFREQLRVVKISPSHAKTIQVKTSTGETYYTQKLVLAAGPWMPSILKRLGINIPLQLSQVQIVYFKPRYNLDRFLPENFPVWEWVGRRFVYGFPIFESQGLKVSFHDDGRDLRSLREFRRTPNADITAHLRSFLNKHIPNAAGEAFGASTCLYTSTPDNDFVVDTIPQFPQIAYFTGCSGHAFHCAPALAQTLAELVIYGKTTLDISRFRLNRFKSRAL